MHGQHDSSVFWIFGGQNLILICVWVAAVSAPASSTTATGRRHSDQMSVADGFIKNTGSRSSILDCFGCCQLLYHLYRQLWFRIEWGTENRCRKLRRQFSSRLLPARKTWGSLPAKTGASQSGILRPHAPLSFGVNPSLKELYGVFPAQEDHHSSKMCAKWSSKWCYYKLTYYEIRFPRRKRLIHVHLLWTSIVIISRFTVFLILNDLEQRTMFNVPKSNFIKIQ